MGLIVCSDADGYRRGRVDTRLLRTCATVARTENLTAAAERLRRVQSTVTAHVRTLENEFDLRLFDRLPRGVLTAAGGAGEQVTGRVVLSAGETLVSARLPGVIAALRRSHPRIQVDLRTMGTAAAIAAPRTGEPDMALLLADEATFRDVDCTPLAREPLVLVCSPELGVRQPPLEQPPLTRRAIGVP